MNTAFYGVSVVCVLAIALVLFNWVKYLRSLLRSASAPQQPGHTELLSAQFPTKSTTFFVGTIALAFAITGAVTERARAYVQDAIASVAADTHIFVNGERPSNAPEVLASLKSMHWEIGHGSHSTTRIGVEVEAPTGNHIFLVLGRDSSIPMEYWVFYPKWPITSNNELGRIRTEAFNAYQ